MAEASPMTAATLDRTKTALPEIPVYEVGPRFGIDTVDKVGQLGHKLLDAATAGVSTTEIRIGDTISRAWLEKHRSPYLDEIREIADRVGRPGAYYFNVHYEWGCTTAAKPMENDAVLVRTLDWETNGLGRHVVAAQIAGPAGSYVALTWPGYTGVLQAMAPGRFAAAINQAPRPVVTGLRSVDWVLDKIGVWRSPHLTPAHLLRRVFEQARTFGEAKEMLTKHPICTSVLYTLAGVNSTERCVIERKETEFRVIEGAATTANDWQSVDWQHKRIPGIDSEARQWQLSSEKLSLENPFAWLRPPVLNDSTRLAVVADPAKGWLAAQGFESDGPATQTLVMSGLQ